MIYRLKHFLIQYRSIITIISLVFRKLNRKNHNCEILKRKKLSIFDYPNLIKEIPYYPYDYVIDNNLYGITFWLKKYANISINKPLNSYIEHGVFFGNLVREDEKKWYTDSVITYGDQRKCHLEKSKINKKIIMVGPFIHYADYYLNDFDFKKLKQKLGKVLLVFPSHSIKQVQSNYNVKEFIEYIDIIKEDFDTVLISMYWLDVLRKDLIELYESKGYLIVTSGHRFDPNFLSRQKTIIELANFSISNSVGSHLGYCIYMNKPHMIFDQSINFSGKSEKEEKVYLSVRNEVELETEKQEKEELCQAFSKYSYSISLEQRKLVDKYWGVSHIKSAKKLSNVLSK